MGIGPRPLIVGSAPLRHYLGRSPSDIDIVCTWDDFQQLAESLRPFGYRTLVESKNKLALKSGDVSWIFDCEIAWASSSAEALLRWASAYCQHSHRYFQQFGFSDIKGEFAIADKDIIYTLKMSHRYKKNSPFFNKTMNDIHELRKAGAIIFDSQWLKWREQETYDYSHPNLNRSKSEFFTDDVTYTYDHDSVHRVVAVDPGIPAYTKYMADGAEVLWSKSKFFALPEEVRIAGVYEESAVLALERAIVPYDVDEERAFPMALEKVCTSITSGAFREYAWEHYHEAMALWRNQQSRGPLIERVRAELVPQ